MALIQQTRNPFRSELEEEKKSVDSPSTMNRVSSEIGKHSSGGEGEEYDGDDGSFPNENSKVGNMVEITNLAHAVEIDLGRKESAKSADDSVSHSSVSFGSVQVREYERVIDSTGIYMGLALGWNYNVQPAAPVSDKVRNKAAKYTAGKGGGEESRMKRTNGSDRYGMLIKYGYVQKELKDATKEAAKFYKQRQREAARSLVVQDERSKQEKAGKPKRRPLLRSMFG